jgi:hypothetical protein
MRARLFDILTFDLLFDLLTGLLQARRAVVQRYAKQLSEAETSALADASNGLSCRDLKEVCEHAERRWVAKVRVTPPVNACQLQLGF